MQGCVINEGKDMKIYAIRNCQPLCVAEKQTPKPQKRYDTPQTEPKFDTVSFRAHETAKGVGIGALLGLGAVTILSGGAAAPLVCGIYAATTGIAGGMLGSAIESVNKKDDENNKQG